MDRVTAKCENCVYFEYREYGKEDARPFGRNLDGWCSKIFPRGYVGAGKPGGKRFHGEPTCFQFELRPEAEQMKMEGMT